LSEKKILPITTAGIFPDLFAENNFPNRKLMLVILAVCLAVGFGLRSWNLGAESLSEDELNKLQTVEDYLDNGLSGKNGEHPFVMKGLQLISVSLSRHWNGFTSGEKSVWAISDEFALRFPTALFGTFTALLLFFLIKELFGSAIGLLTAVLWSVDPMAVGFDRIAKEDSFLLFFFLLANVFLVRSQTLAEKGDDKWVKYLWLTAFAFGGMFASKYLPHLFAISIAYYNIFQRVPTTKWRIGKHRFLIFFVILGISFLILNPTILIPETWTEMLKFSGEKRIGHDSNEFMGQLYRNKVTLWLTGVPWTYYYVFILVKTPLLTLFSFLTGLFFIFRRKFGDGRFFIFFWLFLWFLPFTVMGGKFTRYFTIAEPLLLIIAAVGLFSLTRMLAKKVFPNQAGARQMLLLTAASILVAASLFSSVSVNPHYRLYTNYFGGGNASAGFYFPHDEFYDTSTREAVAEIEKLAQKGAVVANETPYLFEYYIKKNGRADLISVSLSDKEQVAKLSAGDFIVAAKGRRYFSNQAYLEYLEKSLPPKAVVKIGEITSVVIYQLDETTAAQIRELAK
jgi:hypothetical protein